MSAKTNSYYFKSLEKAVLIRDDSRITYRNNLRRAYIETGATSIHDLLSNPEKYIPLLNNSKISKSEHSLVNCYEALLKTMSSTTFKAKYRLVYNQWYKEWMKAKNVIREREMKNIPTQRQKEAYVEWTEILRIRDSYPIDSKEHLLIGIYTYWPPRRQMDFSSLKIYSSPEDKPKYDHNFIHLAHPVHNAFIFLNRFKNSAGQNGFFNKEFPPQLLEAIKMSLQAEPREYLFVKQDGTPHTQGSFTKFSNRLLKRVFKKKNMSVNSFRHSYSTMVANKPGITLGERMKIARQMGHSVVRNLQYAFETKDIHKDEVCYKLNKATGKLEAIKCP